MNDDGVLRVSNILLWKWVNLLNEKSKLFGIYDIEGSAQASANLKAPWRFRSSLRTTKKLKQKNRYELRKGFLVLGTCRRTSNAKCFAMTNYKSFWAICPSQGHTQNENNLIETEWRRRRVVRQDVNECDPQLTPCASDTLRIKHKNVRIDRRHATILSSIIRRYLAVSSSDVSDNTN